MNNDKIVKTLKNLSNNAMAKVILKLLEGVLIMILLSVIMSVSLFMLFILFTKPSGIIFLCAMVLILGGKVLFDYKNKISDQNEKQN